MKVHFEKDSYYRKNKRVYISGPMIMVIRTNLTILIIKNGLC